MERYEHGGNVYNNDIKYDFSANINPLGMPESVRRAVIDSVCACEKYPEPYSHELASAISVYEKYPAENIVCGNGASDLIYRIVSVIKPERAFIENPSFSEYEKSLCEYGCKTVGYPDDNTDMIILGNPNNPTGKTIKPELMQKIADICIRKNIYFLCDECFLDFVRDGRNLSAGNFMNSNIIILRAFTKIYAMAGLRLGYALFGNRELAESVRKSGQCWCVSVPAQLAGIQALRETEYIKKTVSLIESERKFLTENLKRLGMKVYESEANFILFQSKIPLEKFLFERKILIRNCGNFKGLDSSYFRTAVRTHDENIILIKALEEILAE